MTFAWQLGAVGRAEHAACLILHACRYPWTFFEFSKRSLPVSFDTPPLQKFLPRARALARMKHGMEWSLDGLRGLDDVCRVQVCHAYI